MVTLNDAPLVTHQPPRRTPSGTPPVSDGGEDHQPDDPASGDQSGGWVFDQAKGDEAGAFGEFGVVVGVDGFELV